MECLDARSASSLIDDREIFRKISVDRAVNLRFSNITYRVKNGRQTKTILNGISGEFRAGELSAIIGISGCGKTTLLNLLAGYRINTTMGVIRINGKRRNMNAFNRISRYVLQDDDINPNFTVLETMMFASHFKLDTHCNSDQREKVIFEVLDMFRLRQIADTLVANISGGERKRVCIALELIDNPSVILLDEPITGLDDYAASQCIQILHQLAECGRTVICSLHSPSARLLQMVHKIYAISHGECIYQGPMNNIVPYLRKFNLECPITHNPTDFLLDVSIKAYGDYQKELVRETQNGKVLFWKHNCNGLNNINRVDDSDDSNMESIYLSHRNRKDSKVSWWMEYKLLFVRLMQQMLRDKSNLRTGVFSYVLCSIAIGLTYTNINDNANYSPFNYHLAFNVIAAIVFLAMSPPLVIVPQELRFIRREYFNRWYRLSSYFIALFTSQLPLLMVMTMVSAAILYSITGQPMQLWRFSLFVVMLIIISLVSFSFGLLIGSSFNELHAIFVAPMFYGTMSITANQSFHGMELPTFYQIVLYSGFLRFALEGALDTLLGHDRPDFPCPLTEWMCPMSKAHAVLKFFGSLNISYMRSVIVLGSLTVIFTIMSFSIMKYRLKFRKLSKT
ncbi:ATP-binding cassette sub-family G member 1-like [Haematobia irritans]|uniref:ATP-binding cassette sub-family G member 1-like n=1 Tax=Haematobia irritans TaxID=7368 RepID=UPI003F4FC953